MGEILGIVMRAAILAAVAVLPLVVYRRSTLPKLGRLGARRPAYVVLGILAASAVVALIVGYLIATVPWLVMVSLIFLGMLSPDLARPVVTATGGPSGDRPKAEETLIGHLDAARAHRARGDESAWRAELGNAARIWVPTAVSVSAAVRAVLSTPRADMRALHQRLRELEAAARVQWGAPHRIRRLATVAIAAAFLASTAMVVNAQRACVEGYFIVSELGSLTSPPTPPLPEVVLSQPEPGAQLLYESALDLDAAAESRHDPNTREQLVALRFEEGFVRIWRAPDGREIHADAFEFADAAGALGFQRNVTMYACQFSNLAFAAPGGGVGLQVRWSRGDPIVEQVSWVAGSRRFLVDVGHLEPPTDHDRILGIRERAGP